MKRFWLAACAALFVTTSAVRAQSTLDALEQELNEVKQKHQDVTAQTLANFFSQVDAAMASPDAAVSLYQQAGGAMPSATAVSTQHESETVTEREARQALDQANAIALGGVLQVHCGLLHYAALFITKPDQKGLKEDFTAWLAKAAQMYPNLSMPAPGSDGGIDPGGQHHKHQGGGGGAGGGGPAPKPFNLGDVKGKTMRDSIIGKYLGFKAWNDKEQANWAVKDIPKLYRSNVLDPLRATPTAATLAAWDVYIAMANSDEPDNDKWTSSTYPPLQFDRACDDFAITPATEKLDGVLQIIRANPTHPQADDWLARAHSMIDDYRAKHGGAKPVVIAPSAPTPPPTGNPNVVVTTEQQGDATVITTHTNATPSPAPPQ